MPPNIFTYITQEENTYETEQVKIGDNWYWNMRDHVQLIFHLKNGVFLTGVNDWLRAFKNIMEPLLNLSYWSEDIELKDVLFYVENSTDRVKSFLIKKYYDEVYVKENDLDTFLDELTESDLDYGGVLAQKTNTGRPEVMPFNSIAFCDQTDILGSPIAFKHFFSPSKLRKMSKLGWGKEENGATISIEDLILLAENTKAPPGEKAGKPNVIPGKTVEVYILRGDLPDHYLKDNNDMEYYCNQVQIVAYYYDKENNKHGVTLYRKEEDEGNLKFYTSKKVYGRALGRGVGEGLLHPQIWTNFLTIHKMSLMEAAAKVPLFTDDPTYTQRNRIQDMENLEITTVEDGKRIYQVPTAAPTNIMLHEKSIADWFDYAQLSGSAFDPILGKQAVSGTTFRGQERTVAQGKGAHERRRGQRAKFVEILYRDWVIPHMKKQILKGKKFLATLTAEEIGWISQQLAENYATKTQIEEMLNMQPISNVELLKQEFLSTMAKKGNKHLIELLKDEFEDAEISININVASKQKDLVQLSDKLLSIFQVVFQNPASFMQAMKIPALANTFGDILEFGGLSIAEFSSLVNAPPMQPQVAGGVATPQALSQPVSIQPVAA